MERVQAEPKLQHHLGDMIVSHVDLPETQYCDGTRLLRGSCNQFGFIYPHQMK